MTENICKKMNFQTNQKMLDLQYVMIIKNNWKLNKFQENKIYKILTPSSQVFQKVQWAFKIRKKKVYLNKIFFKVYKRASLEINSLLCKIH